MKRKLEEIKDLAWKVWSRLSLLCSDCRKEKGGCRDDCPVAKALERLREACHLINEAIECE